MRKILIILVLLSFISCDNKRNKEVNEVNDISNEAFTRLSEVVNHSYRIILSESDKKGRHWDGHIEDAHELQSTVLQIYKDIDAGISIDKDYVNSLKFNDELLLSLPSNFNSLPKNYKKLLIVNYEQNQLNYLIRHCLFSSFHYHWVKADIQSKKDTINIGEEFYAEISLLASNFRDSVFIYDENDSLIFTGIDSLGSIKFIRKEMTKGLKTYKGYYKASLLKDSKLPRFEVEYYVE